ncbi:MAG: ABC transporter substrate-binding protein [Eubacteriales bacterium]
MKKALFTGIFLLFVLSLVSGCGLSTGKTNEQPEQQLAKNKVRIANVIIAGSPPQGLVMINKGILKEKLGADYEIAPVTTRGIDRVSEEMKNEKYDFLFAYYGTIAEYASNMSEYKNGNNFVVIANIANGPGDKLIAQPAIKEIKQLAGKAVGVFNHDYASVITLANTLKENGLDVVERGGTVKVRLGDSIKMMKDFKVGKLDAIMARASVKDAQFSILKKPGEMAYGGNPPLQVLMVRKAFLKEHPDIVEKVLDAHIEATEWIKKNRQETADIVWMESEKFYKERKMETLMPPKQAMAEIYNKMPVTVYPNLKFTKDIWEYMERYNTKKPYPTSDVVDFTLLNKVLKAKGSPSVEEHNRTEYSN